jgi:hypothetical protein
MIRGTSKSISRSILPRGFGDLPGTRSILRYSISVRRCIALHLIDRDPREKDAKARFPVTPVMISRDSGHGHLTGAGPRGPVTGVPLTKLREDRIPMRRIFTVLHVHPPTHTPSAPNSSTPEIDFLPFLGISGHFRVFLRVKIGRSRRSGPQGGRGNPCLLAEAKNVIENRLRGRVGVRERAPKSTPKPQKSAAWWASWRPGNNRKRILNLAKIRMERGVGDQGAYEGRHFCHFSDDRISPLSGLYVNSGSGRFLTGGDGRMIGFERGERRRMSMDFRLRATNSYGKLVLVDQGGQG